LLTTLLVGVTYSFLSPKVGMKTLIIEQNRQLPFLLQIPRLLKKDILR
jgi:hypothetical protein